MAQIEYDLGAIGTGITKTLLFEGLASSTGTYDLNANVLNYNLIIVEHKSSHDLQKIQAQPFCTISTDSSNAYLLCYGYYSSTDYISFNFSTNGLQFIVNYANGEIITKIYGVN